MDGVLNMTNTIKLETYNPTFPSIELVPDYSIIFEVPYAWAMKEIQEWFDMSVEDFLDWYTYDHSEVLYREAQREKCILNVWEKKKE